MVYTLGLLPPILSKLMFRVSSMRSDQLAKLLPLKQRYLIPLVIASDMDRRQAGTMNTELIVTYTSENGRWQCSSFCTVGYSIRHLTHVIDSVLTNFRRFHYYNSNFPAAPTAISETVSCEFL